MSALNVCRTIIVVLCGLIGASAPAAPVPAPPPRIGQLHDAIRASTLELTNQFAISEAEIAAGRAEDGWTPQVKEAARDWLKSLLPEKSESGQPLLPHLVHYQRHSPILSQANRPHHLVPPASAWADDVSARLLDVFRVRGRFWSEYCSAVASHAEAAWLQAKALEDLRPALRVLAQFRDLALDPVPSTDPRHAAVRAFSPARRSPAGPDVRFAENEPLSALLLLSGPEPLLLPDPEKDPAAYRDIRLRWHNLDGWQLRFLERYRITVRLRERDARFRIAARVAQQDLERLIFAGASVDALQEARARLELFLVPTSSLPQHLQIPPRPALPPARPGPAMPSPFPADYRELLVLPGGQRPGQITSLSYFRPVIEQAVFDAYADLLALIATEAGPEREKRRGPVARQWARYSPEMKIWLRQHLDIDPTRRPTTVSDKISEPQALPPLPAGEPPLRAVRLVLENAASSFREGGSLPGAEMLLTRWRILEDATAPPPAATLGGGQNLWPPLVARPGGAALLAARDAAIRELLGGAASREPLAAVFERVLEAAVLAADWPQVRRVLFIEEIVGALPPGEIMQWHKIPGLFEAAGNAEPSIARAHYLALLHQTVSVAAAQQAARHLKARPPAQE